MGTADTAPGMNEADGWPYGAGCVYEVACWNRKRRRVLEGLQGGVWGFQRFELYYVYYQIILGS